MAYTFKQLQDQLASIIGAEDVADLVDSDIQHVKDVINQCYHECYTPVDGRRARWSERYFAWTIPPSKQIQVTATEGSKTLTLVNAADDVGAAHIGSYIRFGDSGAGGAPYALANRVSATQFTLVEPYAGESGTVSATFYFNSYDLGVAAADLTDQPELAGYGLLSPMSGVGEEIKYRSFLRGDYKANPGQGFNKTLNITYSGTTIEEGVPLFYYIDSAQLSAGAEHTLRFVLYPVPTTEFRIKLRANVVPTLLSADLDEPELPLEAVTTILLPLARAKLAMVSRRYNGDNRTMLDRDAQDAKARLKSFAIPQKRMNRRVHLRPGY